MKTHINNASMSKTNPNYFYTLIKSLAIPAGSRVHVPSCIANCTLTLKQHPTHSAVAIEPTSDQLVEVVPCVILEHLTKIPATRLKSLKMIFRTTKHRRISTTDNRF